MAEEKNKKTRRVVSVIFCGLTIVALSAFCGCSGISGYSNESLYQSDIESVYVEMFESRSFRRGVEYELTDAVAKRIEAETPYKIVTNRNRADSIISGEIRSLGEFSLSTERETGRVLEKELQMIAVVNWKNRCTYH